MSIFDSNMEDLLNDTGRTAADGAEVMKQMETDVPIHPLVSLASIAISLKSISTSLVQINQTLHTGNLGQGDNLRSIKENTDKIARAVESVGGHISSARQDKINALQKAISDQMSRV